MDNQRGEHVTIYWDNNDICEETLSVEGTTHCTNGIVVQRIPYDIPSPEDRPQRLAVPNCNVRSIAMPLFQEIEYIASRSNLTLYGFLKKLKVYTVFLST